MANKLQIISDMQNGELHIQPYGDLDGSAACELVNCLMDHDDDRCRMFIETRGLNQQDHECPDSHRGIIRKDIDKPPGHKRDRKKVAGDGGTQKPRICYCRVQSAKGNLGKSCV